MLAEKNEIDFAVGAEMWIKNLSKDSMRRK